MGFIREPKGVDFYVQSRPLTKKEKAEISNFIRESKAKYAKALKAKKNKKATKSPKRVVHK